MTGDSAVPSGPVEAPPATAPPVALSRNRGYRILWGSQALSEFGFHASMIASALS